MIGNLTKAVTLKDPLLSKKEPTKRRFTSEETPRSSLVHRGFNFPASQEIEMTEIQNEDDSKHVLSDVQQAIYRISNDPRWNFIEEEALGELKIAAMCISEQDDIWIGTEKGDLLVYNGQIALVKQYESIQLITCNHETVFVAVKEEEASHICTYQSRSRKEGRGIPNVHKANVQHMMASDELLFTLGAKEDPCFKIYQLSTYKCYDRDLVPDLPRDWPLVPQEIAYYDGILAVAVHDKLLLYGVPKLLESGVMANEGFRSSLFSLNLGTQFILSRGRKANSLTRVRSWDIDATQICLQGRRIVFLNQNRLSYIDMDLTSEVVAIPRDTRLKCKKLAMFDRYLLSISPTDVLSVWDFDGSLPSAGACLITKAPTANELKTSDHHDFLIHANSKRIVVGLNGIKILSYYMQTPEKIFDAEDEKSAIFCGKQHELLLQIKDQVLTAVDIVDGYSRIIHTLPENESWAQVFAAEGYFIAIRNPTITTNTTDQDDASLITAFVFNEHGDLLQKFPLTSDKRRVPKHWRCVCSRNSICLLSLSFANWTAVPSLKIGLYSLQGNPIGFDTIEDHRISKDDIVHLIESKQENQVLFDDQYKIYLSFTKRAKNEEGNMRDASTVFCVNFKDSSDYVCELNASGSIIKTHSNWGVIQTKDYIVAWNRISTDYSPRQSYVIDIFEKEKGKLVQEFEFVQKSNEKEFYVSACPTEDGKDFVILVSEKRVDTQTWEFFSESELYFVSVASMQLQNLFCIPNEIYEEIYAGKDSFILVGHHYQKGTVQYVPYKRWGISQNLTPIAFVNEIQQMSDNQIAMPFKSQFRDWIIFPEMVNYTHIYAHLNSLHQLQNAIDDKCPLMTSRNNESALSIAIGQKKSATIASIISCIADNPGKGYERLLQGFLNKLAKLPLRRLNEVLDNAMIPYNTMVPAQMPLAKKQQQVIQDSRVLNHKDFSKSKTKGDDKIESWLFSMSAFKLDCALGSVESNKFIDVLINTKYNSILKTNIIKTYSQIMWKKAKPYMLIQELLLFVFCILLSIEVDFEKKKENMSLWTFKLVLLIYLIFLMLNEVYEAILDKLDYLKDFWNLIDIVRWAFCLIYLIGGLCGEPFDSATGRNCAAFALVFSWFRMIALFRLFDLTRYYIRTIIEICKGTLPFLMLFWFTILCISIGINTLRNDPYIDNYQVAYRLAFGDFEDDYPTWSEKYLFKLGTMMMPLTFLNLLIALMGDIFDRVQETQEIADQQECLSRIKEISKLVMCHVPPQQGYIHQCKSIDVLDFATDDWGGKINAIKSSMTESFDSIESKFESRLYDIQSSLGEVEERSVARFKKSDDEGNKRHRGTQKKLESMKNEIADTQRKLDLIMTHLGIEAPKSGWRAFRS